MSIVDDPPSGDRTPAFPSPLHNSLYYHHDADIPLPSLEGPEWPENSFAGPSAFARKTAKLSRQQPFTKHNLEEYSDSSRAASFEPKQSHSNSSSPTPTREEDSFSVSSMPPKRGGRGRGRGTARGGRGGRGGAATAAAAAAAIANDVTAMATRPGRRGRFKTSDNTRVQISYDRQVDIRESYRSLAKDVKNALVQAAEKDLQELLDDPEAYKNRPGYPTIMKELEEKKEEALRLSNVRFEHEAALLKKSREGNDWIAKQSLQSAVKDLQDDYELRIKKKIMDMASEMFPNVSSTPPETVKHFEDFQETLDKERIDRESRALKRRAAADDTINTPAAKRSRGGLMSSIADAPVIGSTDDGGDSTTHTPSRLNSEDNADDIESEGDEADTDEAPKTPTAQRSRAGLVGTSAKRPLPPPSSGVRKELGQRNVRNSRKATDTEGNSVANMPEAPASASAAILPSAKKLGAVEGTKDWPKYQGKPQDQAPAPKDPRLYDEYGFASTTYNAKSKDSFKNGIWMNKQLVEWEDGDIGDRSIYHEFPDDFFRKERGMPLNPGCTYWNPRSTSEHDMRTYTEDDFDKEDIKKYNVHPRFGLPMPSSHDVEFVVPSSYEVQRSHPVVMKSLNVEKEDEHLSRSARWVYIQQDWEEFVRKPKLQRVLKAFSKKEGMAIEPATDEELGAWDLKDLKGTQPSIEIFDPQFAELTEDDIPEPMFSLIRAANVMLDKEVAEEVKRRKEQAKEAERKEKERKEQEDAAEKARQDAALAKPPPPRRTRRKTPPLYRRDYNRLEGLANAASRAPRAEDVSKEETQRHSPKPATFVRNQSIATAYPQQPAQTPYSNIAALPTSSASYQQSFRNVAPAPAPGPQQPSYRNNSLYGPLPPLPSHSDTPPTANWAPHAHSGPGRMEHMRSQHPIAQHGNVLPPPPPRFSHPQSSVFSSQSVLPANDSLRRSQRELLPRPAMGGSTWSDPQMYYQNAAPIPEFGSSGGRSNGYSPSYPPPPPPTSRR